ncbi:endonuclease domain-containing protein [Propionibacteriaceae bacterium G1746]
MTTTHHCLIIRREVPASHRSHLDEQVRRGALHALLPGVYTALESTTWLDQVQAAQAARPEAVIVSATAAKLLFWPRLECDKVHISPARFRNPPEWLVPCMDRIPDELTVRASGLRLASPALAALQLAATLGGEPIDQLLRSRRGTIQQLVDAHRQWPQRAGNRERARLLRDSRDSPWSELERRGHRVLRKAGLQGWRANHRVVIAGEVYYIDVAFPGLKLAIEFDSWAYHGDREAMEADAIRHNNLVAAGWTVLRFTWKTVHEMPAVVIPMLRKLARR